MTQNLSEAAKSRARQLEDEGLNGLHFLLVDSIDSSSSTSRATLHIYLFNDNIPSELQSENQVDLFEISGGDRIKSGDGGNQLKVTSVSLGSDKNILDVTIEPIGDYSIYTLAIKHYTIDPFFSSLKFRFRPGCYDSHCSPQWNMGKPSPDIPPIDYLAKDYGSFRHELMSWMMKRIRGWQPTSEADLDQVLIDLISAAGDELSDYQDRVMNEAYLNTARKRVSLARHARLMDYHIHQGNQASTWITLYVDQIKPIIIPAGLGVCDSANFSGSSGDPKRIKSLFVTREDQEYSAGRLVHNLLNEMQLYTWNGAVTTLPAGTTRADLKLVKCDSLTQEEAVETVRDLILCGDITHLLLEQKRNPRNPDLDPDLRSTDINKRQLLKLSSDPEAIEGIYDPLVDEWALRVSWESADKLKSTYCFALETDQADYCDVSLFHGNLIKVFHGRLAEAEFRDPLYYPDVAFKTWFEYERTSKWGVACRLPESPLAYLQTPPDGSVPTKSTLNIEIANPAGESEIWEEVSSLVHSNGNKKHFVVETDENGTSCIRFGNGRNGRELPEGAIVRCVYQISNGVDGNVGADSLINLVVPSNQSNALKGLKKNEDEDKDKKICWNPFSVSSGCSPEHRNDIIRRVPEAYRSRQLRAITLDDYVQRAEELPEVSRAAASYVWTGSWRAVRITLDPVNSTKISDELRKKASRYLNAVRLIGDEIEIRDPILVSLDIKVGICIRPDYWKEDIRFILEQEFTSGFTPDGRPGFFHPDQWTFGKHLYASQIAGRIQNIKGIGHVIEVKMALFGEEPRALEVFKVDIDKIILVESDPDHLELGSINFVVKGGRHEQ